MGISESSEDSDIDIINLDGAARAYFEIPCVIDDAVQCTERVVYRTLIFMDADPKKAMQLMRDAVSLLETSLRIRCVTVQAATGIIWWRRHIQIQLVNDYGASAMASARLATTPELSEATWDRLGKLDMGASDVDGYKRYGVLLPEPASPTGAVDG